jgi:uncharacterized membrane protein YtjA (UPF0391 family)
MIDTMTGQRPANDRIVDRIASSPRAFVQRQQGCVGGTAAARGRTTAFLASFCQVLAGNGRPFWHSAWNIRARLAFFRHQLSRRTTMFGWALTFLIVALIAAVLGFGGIAGFAVEIAQLIFYVAIILLVISVVVGLIRGRTPTVP